MAINKVAYGNTVLLDVSGDTVTVGDVVAGVTFHLRDGTVGTGTVTNGDNIGYGITDGTLPKAGIAKAGTAVLGG